MKKLYILTLLLIWTFTLSAQTNNYIEYYRNIEKGILKGVFEENNDTTIYYFNYAFEKAEAYPEDLLIISKVYYDNKNNNKAFEYLIKSLENGIDTAAITNIGISSLLNHQQKELLIEKYNNYKIEYDTVLLNQLDSIIELDQYVREFDWNDTASVTYQSSLNKMSLQDSLNRIWILNTIKEKGWMGRKLIGNDGTSFLLLLHIHTSWINTNFEILEKEILKGNLNPSYLAATLDRPFFINGNLKYRSFLPGNFNTPKDTEEMKTNRYKIGALSSNVFLYRSKFKHRY